MAKDIEEIRKTLHLLKPKGFKNFVADGDGNITNLDAILAEYRTIKGVAKDLVPIKGQSFQDALTSQSSEYLFFRQCVSNLKAMLDYYDALVRHTRGKEYKKIRKSESKEYNDRAINSLIDSNVGVLNVTYDMLKVKEMYDIFQGIVESYSQRGYSLNNITKGLEMAFQDIIL